jgi:Polyketide cyclase / dehydrase and lipid transport.
MKIILIILAVIAGIIVLGLIIALFVKKDYSVVRQVVIARPKQQVFDYIRFLKNQDNFSKWASMDPAMKKEYKGTDGTAGFVSSWDSEQKNVGKGEQEILNVVEGERITYEIRFIKPFEAKAQAYMLLESSGADKTTVKWGFQSRMNYPMNLMLLLTNMEHSIGEDFTIGLNNLKNILKKN